MISHRLTLASRIFLLDDRELSRTNRELSRTETVNMDVCSVSHCLRKPTEASLCGLHLTKQIVYGVPTWRSRFKYTSSQTITLLFQHLKKRPDLYGKWFSASELQAASPFFSKQFSKGGFLCGLSSSTCLCLLCVKSCSGMGSQIGWKSGWRYTGASKSFRF